MITIEKKVQEAPIKFGIKDQFFQGLNYGIFDIESTGLSPKKCSLILSGFYIPCQDGTFTYKQFFAENLEEEGLVIMETLKTLRELDYIVTFNGKAFDIPFLEKRMNKLGIPKETMPYNLDIYVLCRKYSDLKNLLPNLKQKTVEVFMGLSDKREDQIDGAQSVKEYYQYLETKDPEALEKILLHNRDDVLQLYKLQKIIMKTDFYRAMCVEGFPVKSATVSNLKLSTKKLVGEGRYMGQCSYSAFFDEKGTTMDFSCEAKSFSIKLELLSLQNVTFADLDVMGLNHLSFENINGYFEGNLILAKDKEVNYQGVSLLVKKFIEEVLTNEL